MAHLIASQRYAIESMYKQGYSYAEIGRSIDKNRSVIWREINRNSDGRSSNYTADLADRKAHMRHKNKPKIQWLTPELLDSVIPLLEKLYSPEQITATLRNQGITCVSHETIYQYIWEDKRKGGKLHTFLRRRGRSKQKRGTVNGSRGAIPNRVDIDHRPGFIDKRKRFGDLEIDTIIGKNHKGAIVTINDRASGVLWAKKVPSREATEVTKATIELLEDSIPFIHTITADNGKEFAGHQEIAEALKIDFYFAKPYHSWERGSNENLNGLIRQYIPKKTDFNQVSDDYVKMVKNELNDRPRKRHQYKKPTFVRDQLLFNQNVAFVT